MNDLWKQTVSQSGFVPEWLSNVRTWQRVRDIEIILNVINLLITCMFYRYYGCGLVIPEQLDGMDVLDLGGGAGQDCFVLSKLVGESGSVTGVDMTDEQV